MRRSLLRNLSLCTRRNLHLSSNLESVPFISNGYINNYPVNHVFGNGASLKTFPSTQRFFSSDNRIPAETAEVEDVSNKELKLQLEEYLNDHSEDALPDIFVSVLKRKLSEKHEETDDELMDELSMKPLDDVKNEEFDDDFDYAHETDEEVDDLCNARDITVQKMKA